MTLVPMSVQVQIQVPPVAATWTICSRHLKRYRSRGAGGRVNLRMWMWAAGSHRQQPFRTATSPAPSISPGSSSALRRKILQQLTPSSEMSTPSWHTAVDGPLTPETAKVVSLRETPRTPVRGALWTLCRQRVCKESCNTNSREDMHEMDACKKNEVGWE